MFTSGIDTVELSSAATRGTEAPTSATRRPRSGAINNAIAGILRTGRAQRLREWRTILDTVAPPDVHRARLTPGVTAIERFALVEAWR